MATKAAIYQFKNQNNNSERASHSRLRGEFDNVAFYGGRKVTPSELRVLHNPFVYI